MIPVSRRSARLAAAVLAAGLAVAACSTIKMGAAAVTASGRISTSTLTAEVANLNSAYAADKAKGITPQHPVGQEAQQVLSWLISFQVYDQMAVQNGVSVSRAQAQAALAAYAAQAKASHLSLAEYWSAGAALPPDLLPQVGRAAAIEIALANRLDGGKTPTTTAGQAALTSKLSHYQCLAAKGLQIEVNPQFGQYDYTGFSVAPAPSALAADPVPSPTPSVRLTPPC